MKCFHIISLFLLINNVFSQNVIYINDKDIDDTYGKMKNSEMYYWIKEHLDFDQMIWEFGDDDNPDWVHISYVSKEKNRNRCLKAYKDNRGKTKYKVI